MFQLDIPRNDNLIWNCLHFTTFTLGDSCTFNLLITFYKSKATTLPKILLLFVYSITALMQKLCVFCAPGTDILNIIQMVSGLKVLTTSDTLTTAFPNATSALSLFVVKRLVNICRGLRRIQATVFMRSVSKESYIIDELEAKRCQYCSECVEDRQLLTIDGPPSTPHNIVQTNKQRYPGSRHAMSV